jgi:hypothetical protein
MRSVAECLFHQLDGLIHLWIDAAARWTATHDTGVVADGEVRIDAMTLNAPSAI